LISCGFFRLASFVPIISHEWILDTSIYISERCRHGQKKKEIEQFSKRTQVTKETRMKKTQAKHILIHGMKRNEGFNLKYERKFEYQFVRNVLIS
jgi:hypothetical protein